MNCLDGLLMGKPLSFYLTKYINSHSELDNSIINLVILPILGTISSIIALFSVFQVLFCGEYEDIRRFRKCLGIIFIKSNFLTIGYLDWKSVKNNQSPVPLLREESPINNQNNHGGENNNGPMLIEEQVTPRIDGMSIRTQNSAVIQPYPQIVRENSVKLEIDGVPLINPKSTTPGN